MKNYFIQSEVSDILRSILSLNLKNEILMTTLFGGFSIGAMTGVVSNWIFEPAVSYYCLIALILSDHVSGIVLAFKHDKFETRKALRLFWTLLSHTGLLLFATNLSKGSDALIWLNEAIFVPLVIVSMLSLIKNLSLLNLINPVFAEIFYKKIDAYKNELYNSKPKKEKENDIGDNDFPFDGC